MVNADSTPAYTARNSASLYNWQTDPNCTKPLYSKSSITTIRHATGRVPFTASTLCTGSTYASHSTCAAALALAHFCCMAVSLRVQNLTITERSSIVARNTPLAMCCTNSIRPPVGWSSVVSQEASSLGHSMSGNSRARNLAVSLTGRDAHTASTSSRISSQASNHAAYIYARWTASSLRG